MSNQELVVNRLREEWGFDGYFVSDFLALMAAWIRYDRAANAEATISVNVDAGLLSIDNQYGYFRQIVDGTDIHVVSSRLFTVYFTDSAACTANGTPLGNAETSLKDSAALITVARELCLNGSFRCETIGGARVFTLNISADNVKTILEQVLPDLSVLDVSYEDCVLTVTVRDDVLYSVELKCGGTLKVVMRDLDASANVIVRFVEPTAHQIPQSVQDTLLSEGSETA